MISTRLRRFLYFTILVLLLVSITTQLAVALGNSIPASILEKIDPALHDDLASDELVEVVIRVRSLPVDVAIRVKGKYRQAIDALKAWAEYSQQPVVNAIRALGGQVLNRFWLDNVLLARIPGKQILNIASMPDVVKVFRNFEVYVIEPVSKIPVDQKEIATGQVSSWGIFKIRAPEVWAMGYTGTGVRIAVLDTGVDITHPALAGKMLTIKPEDPYYPGGWMAFDHYGIPYRTKPHDTHGHGTHCSGTALGGNTVDTLIGVAPGATLMHGLVLPGGSGTFAQVLAGMQWAVEPYYLDPASNRIYTGLPAHVVSMSFGAHEYYGNELLPAIQAMLLANIVPVAAIGNGGSDTTANPGNIWGVFGVGATDITEAVPWWSGGRVVTWPWPPPTWPFFDVYPSMYTKPDFSAPGVHIRSAVPGGRYEDWSGTSMATPHVAGLAALILQITGWNLYQVPDIPEKVYLILKATAIDLGDPGQDTRYGWGRVDAYEAAKKALEYTKKSGVEGYVRDEVTGKPIPWATVTVVEADITIPVTMDGYFRIPLEPGKYTLVVQAWGYQTVTLDIEVVLLNGTIIGRVYNALTSAPIPNASVSVVELNLTAYTDVDGAYSISVPPGTYTLIAEAPGHAPANTTVTVDEAEVVVVDFALFPVGNGTIAGYVLHATTGAPIANATVWVYVNGNLVINVTNTEGYYELNVPSGIYTVYAYKPGFTQANVANVVVLPSLIAWANFTFHPVPPTVVVLANVHYFTRPHLKDIAAALGLPVIEYSNMTKLLEDWIAGIVNPKVVIVDHTMPDRFAYPPSTIALAFHILADASGTTLVWLGTSYSGYTGIDVLLLYNADLVSAGYPAPWSRLVGWPPPMYVQVTILNITHPLFTNVKPDIPPNIFYLGTGNYTDYAMYNFTDPTGRFRTLAYVNDTRYPHHFGVGVAEWFTDASVPWYYLGSWAESYWMQYLEPGFDGMYTDNAKRVLENAILLGWKATPAYIDASKLARALELFYLGTIKPSVRPAISIKLIKPQIYTYIEVYMKRLPHGYVTGTVIGADGVILKDAKVEFVGTPVAVYTNLTGQFYTWLPAGEYTAIVSAPGYRSVNITFTVEVNVTKDLGIIVLPVVLRVATLYDYADSIKSALTAAGFYAVSYRDLAQLIEDLKTGFYHAVVWAGYHDVPYPPCMQFYEFLGVVESLRIGVVFMDSWGYYGYGIKVLNLCLYDPPYVGFGWWAWQVSIVVTQPHPILKGYRVGDVIPILTTPWWWGPLDYSWFHGFSGVVIADLLVHYWWYWVPGNAIAWTIRPSGSRWVLLSSFAPTPWNLPEFFTKDAWNIIVNSVKWVGERPLNVTLENPYLHVGDTARLLISGAPIFTELVVLINGTEIGRTLTNGTGEAVFEFTIPLIPGGKYLVEVMTPDELYYGSTNLYILPKIVVTPKYTTTPGLVHLVVTGLAPRQQVYLYLDGNWLTLMIANESGAFSTRLNIPIIVEGTHEILLVDPTTGTVLVSEFIEVLSRLDYIARVVDELKLILLELKPAITRIDENVVILKTAVGEIRFNVTEFRLLIESSRDAIITEIRGGVAEILIALDNRTALLSAKLDTLDAKLTAIRGDIAYLNTSIGNIKVSLSELRSLVESSRDAVIAEIRGSTATIRLQLENTTVTLKAELDDLDIKITDVKGDVAYLNTSIGEVKVNLSELRSLIESSRDAIIAEIRNNTAVLKLQLENITITLKTDLDDLGAKLAVIKGDVAYLNTSIGELKASLLELRSLVESSRDAIITEIRNGTAVIRLQLENTTMFLSARLDDLGTKIIDIRDNIAYINTSIGNVKISLSELKSLVESSRDAIIAEIRNNTATIRLQLENTTITLIAKLDMLDAKITEIKYDSDIAYLNTSLGEIKASLSDLISLVSSSKDAIITEIRNGTASILLLLENTTVTLSTRLDILAIQLISIKGDVAYLNTTLGEVKVSLSELRTLVSSSKDAVITKIENSTATIRLQLENTSIVLSTKLDILNAKVVAIRDEIIYLNTSLGLIQVGQSLVLARLSELNSTIMSITSDLVTIKTSFGELRVGIDELVSALRSVNATISGLIVDSNGKILARIETTSGEILADIQVVRDLIERGIPVTTGELKDLITKLYEDAGEACSKAEQAGMYGIIASATSVLTLALVSYLIITKRRSTQFSS